MLEESKEKATEWFNTTELTVTDLSEKGNVSEINAFKHLINAFAEARGFSIKVVAK